MKRNEINYLLHEARIKKGKKINEVSSDLHISKLKLSLIEKGYIRPTRSLRKKLINYYSLNEDFFSKNSRHIYPIDKDVVKKKESKLFNFIKSKKCKFISLGLLAVFSGVIALGFYNLNFKYTNPKEYFTNDLNAFLVNFKKDKDVKSKASGNDIVYTFTITSPTGEGESRFTTATLETYEKAENVQNTIFNIYHQYKDLSNPYLLSYSISCSNQKVCIISSITYPVLNSEPISTLYSILSYIDYVDESYKFDIFNVSRGNFKGIDSSSEEYKKVTSDFELGVVSSINYINDIFTSPDHNFVYKDALHLILDIRKIVSQNTTRFRVGVGLLFSAAFMVPISLFFLIFSFILSFKPKTAEVKAYNKSKKELIKEEKPKKHWWQFGRKKYTKIDSIPYRAIPNDFKFTPFIPETALKIISILLVVIYSLALNLSVYDRININLIVGDVTLNTFQKYASNFLVGGVLLMFFVKLDINHKRSQKQLISDIFLMFIIGLIYYLAENVLIIVVGRKEDLFSFIVNFFTNLIPGNIFWSLMMYSCIYFFLFITPKNLEKDKRRLIGYRCISLIPLSILLFSFIFKFYLSDNTNISKFISTIFYTKSTILTSFAVLYLYIVFFFRGHLIKKYGKEQCDIYFESARYNFSKNIIASLIIIALFAFDLWAKYNVPDATKLKLGNNWAIIILVPFILFYRSHIGKRNPHLDVGLQVGYIGALASAYIIMIFTILNRFDLGVLLRFLG